MLLNLTLFYLTSSNFSPSPLISGQIQNLIIQNSYISKSFSHFVYLSRINQFRAYSSNFSFFLNTAFIISSKNAFFFTCNSTKDLDIVGGSFAYFNLCNFTSSSLNARGFELLSISKSIFQGSWLKTSGCKELYFSKTVFHDCYSSDLLIYSPWLGNFTFQNCEVADCKHVFDFGNYFEQNFFNINHNNFININMLLFSKTPPITISQCYFKNVQKIMGCTETPMGCLNNAKIIDCSCEGELPEGFTGSFNKDDAPTKIYIDTLKPNDCDFYNLKASSLPSASPLVSSNIEFSESSEILASQSATQSASQSPQPTQTLLPTASKGPKAKFPVIYIIIIVVVVVVLIIIIIIIVCCVRKYLDMKQENLLDRGYMLKYNAENVSDSTSDRSNVLNIHGNSNESNENSDDDGDFFSNKPKNKNRFIDQNDDANDDVSYSSFI